MAGLKKQLVTELEKIKNLEERSSKVASGSALFFKGKEIAHFHHNNEIDVRLTRKLIRREGLVHPTNSRFHKNRSSSSEWMELRFTRSAHVQEIVRLFKLALKEY